MITLLASILIASSFADMNHDDIVKALKQPVHKNEIMSVSPNAKQLRPLNELFGKDVLKKLSDEKKLKPAPSPSPSPSPVAWSVGFFPDAYAGGGAKPTPPPSSTTEIDLRFRDTPVKNQIGPRCTSYGLIAAIENLEGSKTDLSESELWSRYQQYSVYPALSSAQKDKITLEKFWPENSTYGYAGYQNNRRTKLVSYRDLGSNYLAAKDELLKGHPIYFAFSVPKDMTTCSPVIREDSAMTDGGHAIVLVGVKKAPELKSGFYFIAKNSWGTACHDHGYFYLTPEFCKRPDGYCTFFAIQEVAD